MSQEARQQRSSFSIENILGDSRNAMTGIKEASAQNENQNGTKEASDAQDAEFGAILDSLTREKTASDASEELSRDEVRAALNEKVAALAGVNQSGLIKEAQLIGAAVHDGFLARATESEFHATKIAQVMELEDPDLEKIAEDIGYNEGVKVAMQIAANEIAEGEKLAAVRLEQAKHAAYNAGHLDTLEWLGSFAE